MSDVLDNLKQLKPRPSKKHSITLSEEEGFELLRQYRQGVKVQDLMTAINKRSLTSLYQAFGTWALRHANKEIK